MALPSPNVGCGSHDAVDGDIVDRPRLTVDLVAHHGLDAEPFERTDDVRADGEARFAPS